MVDSILNCGELEAADAVVLGVPYDHGASFGGGAAEGPEAVFACLDRQIELFERHTRTEPAKDYRIAAQMLELASDLPPEAMVAGVANAVAAIRSFPLVVGGIHSVTIGALQALTRRLDPREVTVLHLDAHLDLRDDDSDYNDRDPSRFAHSCVMRRAVEMGYRTCQVGIRAYSADEWTFATDNGLSVFEWGRGERPGPDAILAAIETSRVYLTIDVDGFDPAVAPATGTPVPGGLSWDEGTALIRRVCRDRNLVGADVVEVAPVAHSGLSEYAAAQLAYDVMAYHLLKRDGRLAYTG